jgi:hypothetical protein
VGAGAESSRPTSGNRSSSFAVGPSSGTTSSSAPWCSSAMRRLFALDALGEGGWLKAMSLEGYAPRRPGPPRALQEALFPFSVGWG